MSTVTYLTEKQAAQIQEILGGDPVALIAVDPEGKTRDFSLGTGEQGGDREIDLDEFTYVDLGCILYRHSGMKSLRCCYWRCDASGCRCLWWC